MPGRIRRRRTRDHVLGVSQVQRDQMAWRHENFRARMAAADAGDIDLYVRLRQAAIAYDDAVREADE